MKKYKDSGAADEFKQKKKQAEKERKAADKKAKAPPSKKTKNTSVGSSSGKFTSKEYVEDDDSSSDSGSDKKKETKEVSRLNICCQFKNLFIRNFVIQLRFNGAFFLFFYTKHKIQCYMLFI